MKEKTQYERFVELSENGSDIQLFFDNDKIGGVDFEVDNGVYKWTVYYDGKEEYFDNIEDAWDCPLFDGLSPRQLKEKGYF